MMGRGCLERLFHPLAPVFVLPKLAHELLKGGWGRGELHDYSHSGQAHAMHLEQLLEIRFLHHLGHLSIRIFFGLGGGGRAQVEEGGADDGSGRGLSPFAFGHHLVHLGLSDPFSL